MVTGAGGESGTSRRCSGSPGADAEALGINGRTALYHALKYEYVGVIQALLKNNVDANARDTATSLHLVSGIEHHDAVRLLFQHGADIHVPDDKDQTLQPSLNSYHHHLPSRSSGFSVESVPLEGRGSLWGLRGHT